MERESEGWNEGEVLNGSFMWARGLLTRVLGLA